MSDLPRTRPSPADLAALAERHPRNPFLTPAYAQARVSLGAVAWLVGRGGLAFAQGRLRSRTLEVPSVTGDDDPVAFARALEALARRRLWWTVRLESFGSPAGTRTPRLAGERARVRRVEHVLTLTDGLDAGLSANHRRSVRKARDAGIRIEHRADAQAADEHAALMTASLDRRAQRGEEVPAHLGLAEVRALVASGAGTLVRAIAGDGTAESSLLMLRAARGAYYHSAGTSPRGMRTGASPLLILEAAEGLRAAGCDTFNLGGAVEEETGLYRFKRGFGGAVVELERAEASTAPWRRARPA